MDALFRGCVAAAVTLFALFVRSDLGWSGVLRAPFASSFPWPCRPGTSLSYLRFDMATERSLAALLRSLQTTSSFEDASG